ncbi:MAG: hypothetical protein K5739_05825 [Lachnospiraceae bacterium]|nr:hypothetical protein [Lachnospiraceae bacterium]
MWCPVCKNEYREGFTHCPDCDVDLVESLDDSPTPIIFGEEETIRSMEEFLLQQGLEGVSVRFDEKDKVHELFVRSADMPAAKELLTGFISELEEQMRRDAGQEDLAGDEQGDEMSGGEQYAEEDLPLRPRTYESSRQKAEEYRSSGGALMIVGAIGVVAVILLYLGVIPIPLAGSSKVMICGVMGAMFLVFLCLGIAAFRSQKGLLDAAEKEEELIGQINDYLKENLSKAQIEERAAVQQEEEFSEEQAYFPRMEVILTGIKNTFPGTDELLLEKLADDWYNSVYTKENED